MCTVQSIFIFMVISIIAVSTNIYGGTVETNQITKDPVKSKPSVDDDFKVLLELYKLNPLRNSKIYNAFSKKILGSYPMTNEFNKYNKPNEIVKYDPIINYVNNSESVLNDTTDTEPNFTVNGDSETFEVNGKILANALKVIQNSITKNKSDDIFNLIRESMNNVDKSNDYGKYVEKTSALPIVKIPDDFSIPYSKYGNEIKTTRASTVGKVESNAIFDDNDYIIVL